MSGKKTDKFAPLRELFTEFNESLKRHYEPGPCVTIDETLRSFRGNCSFVTYMPNKPVKYGLLSRDMCDSDSLYMYDILPYAGKAADPDPSLHITGASNMVRHMASSIEGSGRNITMDRFFTGVELAEELLEKKLTVVGTIQKSRRHIPEELKNPAGREKLSTMFAWSDKTMMASYCKAKNKVVLMLSTQHNQPLVSTCEHKKPEVILSYNATKGGIDTCDQMMERYTCRITTRRWPMAYFLMILDIAGMNAWVILRENCPESPYADTKRAGRRAFLQDLGMTLIKPAIEARLGQMMREGTRAAISAVLKRKIQPPAPEEREEQGTAGRKKCHLCIRAAAGESYTKDKVKQGETKMQQVLQGSV